MALAYLLRKPVRIQNIRGKRGNKAGGLGHQHLTGVRLYLLIRLAQSIKAALWSKGRRRLYQKQDGHIFTIQEPDQQENLCGRLPDSRECPSNFLDAVTLPSFPKGT